MFRKITLIVLAAMAMQFSANAQHICGFDLAHSLQMANNPAYAAAVQKHKADWAAVNNLKTANRLITSPTGSVTYEIPVVVHVIHTGGAIGTNYNPSTAQLTSLISYLDQAYEATYAPWPDSMSGGTHFPVKFVLAKRDPNCDTTTGIVRVNGSSISGYTSGGVDAGSGTGASEAAVKGLSDWPNTDYVNIWIVNKIDGEDGYTSVSAFTAGYAYFPGVAANLDGMIMLAYVANAGESTLPHEIGHMFGLYHTFEGDGSGCPANTSCTTQGDEVCDTDPHQNSFGCPSGTNPCTGTSWNPVVHNIMSYFDCTNRFSAGQRTKWMYNLMNYRPSLMSSMGGVYPEPMVAASCIPTIVNPSNSYNIGPVFVGLNDLNGVTNGGYNSDGNMVYVDKSCHQQAHVQAGTDYTLEVESNYLPEKVAVYIDYNNDGIFTASELVYSHTGTVFNELHSTTISIPVTGIVTCTPVRMRVVTDRATAAMPTSCSALQYGQAEDYSVVIQGPSNSATVSNAITTGTNPSCFGDTLTFTATPAGTYTGTLIYEWFLNGTSVGTGTTYTSATVTTGDVVTAKLYYMGTCGQDTATSNAITVVRQATVAPTVTIGITAGNNPGCMGDNVTFTAVGTNTGTAPTFAWTVNGGAAGTTASTFSSSTLSSGDVIHTVMTSNSGCAVPLTASSNSITYVILPDVTPSVSINITAGSNPGCLDSLITFMAAGVNMGSITTYTWLVNGTAVFTGTTFSTTTLNDGDVVTVYANTGGTGCRTADTALSAAITMSLSVSGASPLISYIGNTLVSDISTVQWYGPSGMIPGATGSSYTPTVPGTYYAVNTGSGCNSPQSNSLLVSLLTIGSFDMSTLTLYPNPTKGELTLDFGNTPNNAAIQLFTSTGKLMLSDNMNNQTHRSFDISSFANGVYFLVLQDADGRKGTVQVTVLK